MKKMWSNWPTLAASCAVVIILAGVLIFENDLTRPGIVKSIDPELLPNLYQVAVSGILDQSSFFSSWSVGLIVAAWYVMVHGLEKASHTSLTAGFIFVCGLTMLSLFLGQMLHEVVISSIALGQDPLLNPRSSSLLMYQFWTTVASAALVAIAVVGRVVCA
ncbi:hypothetical protein NKJ86_10535 [Mesorhizobium sp. M0025]|uniref:hypothetical protein n=1 Tax=Mesorhizobium sp. M0025 TaxID=2956846 RepID=UPI00333A9608